MSVSIKKDEDTGEYYIDVKDLSEFFEDVNKISHYSISELENGVVKVEFYDENNEKVLPKVKK